MGGIIQIPFAASPVDVHFTVKFLYGTRGLLSINVLWIFAVKLAEDLKILIFYMEF